MRTDYCGDLRPADAGRVVQLCGWVARRREHGEHLAFVDLRDHTGVVQCVVSGAHDLRPEYVLRIGGTVRLRERGEERGTETRPRRARGRTRVRTVGAMLQRRRHLGVLAISAPARHAEHVR